MKTTIQKEKNHAFGKDIYLLGIDKDGKKYWLEAPSYDCGWYWGFGYVETYTNNERPDLSRDVDSHQHIDGFTGKQNNGEFIHNIYDSPTFQEVTFTESEGWQLSELFKQFYLLREMAEFAHKEKPGCNISTSPVIHVECKGWNDTINSSMIPRITAKILEILSPKEETEE